MFKPGQQLRVNDPISFGRGVRAGDILEILATDSFAGSAEAANLSTDDLKTHIIHEEDWYRGIVEFVKTGGMEEGSMMKYSFSSDGILFIAEAEGSDVVRRCNKVHETFDNLHDWIRMMKAAGAEISVE